LPAGTRLISIGDVRSRLLIFAVVAASIVAGCGGGDSGGNASATPSQHASGGGSTAVSISNFKFAPATLTVKAGDQVTVTNDDSTAHTATADDGSSFDTGDVAPNASQTISVSKPGRYPYHCSIHSFMHGTLVVK
jgi:plastocyanin